MAALVAAVAVVRVMVPGEGRGSRWQDGGRTEAAWRRLLGGGDQGGVGGGWGGGGAGRKSVKQQT